MSIPKAVIKVGGPIGRHTTVTVGDVPLTDFHVSRLELVIDAHDVNRLTVEHAVSVDEVEVEGVVLFRAVLARAGQPLAGYRYGEGDTPKEAILHLASKL